MQAIASSTSERAPMMCDGSSLSDTSGGIRNPVALVRIVSSRNSPVRPSGLFDFGLADITMKPATIGTMLMTVWTRTNVDKLIPSIMTRPRFLELLEGYDGARKISTRLTRKQCRHVIDQVMTCPNLLHFCHK